MLAGPSCRTGRPGPVYGLPHPALLPQGQAEQVRCLTPLQPWLVILYPNGDFPPSQTPGLVCYSLDQPRIQKPLCSTRC